MRRYGLATWLDDGRPSGANRRLRELQTELANLLDTDETIVVLRGPNTPRPPDHPRLEIEDTGIPARPTLRRILRERTRLPSLCRSLDLDVLDLQALPVPPRIGIPTVCTVHDLRDLGEFARRPRFLLRRTLRVSAGRVSSFVTPSGFVAEQLRAVLGADRSARVAVVPNAADHEFLAVRRRPSEAAFILHVGHLEARKDLDTLIRAVASSSRTDLRAILVGEDAGAEKALRALAASAGIARRIEFRHGVDDDEVRSLLATCGAVVVPSREEGFGLPALEALAAGCPTIVSRFGALPEVVGDAGVVVASDSIEDWSNTIDRSLDRLQDHLDSGHRDLVRPRQAQTPDAPSPDAPSPEAERIERRRRRAEQFDWRRSAEQLLDLWREYARSQDAST